MSKAIILGLDGACPDIINAKIKQGMLPNFERLREMGTRADNVPYPSAVTPGNWTSIATGTKPWTNGISDFCMHEIGTPLDERYSVFDKTVNNRAEFAWDALSDREKKTATIAFPGALPQTKPYHLAIGNYGFPTENADPWTIAPSRALVAGSLNPVGPYDWKEHEEVKLEPVTAKIDIQGFTAHNEITFSIRGTNEGYRGEHLFSLVVGRCDDEDGAVLVHGDTALLLQKNQWTPFIEKPFERDNAVLQKWLRKPLEQSAVTGEFRMRITELDVSKGELLLYISTVYPTYDFSTNPEFTRDLRDRFGPYNDNLGISRLLSEWIDNQGFYDEFRLQGVWEAKAAVYLVNECDYDMVFAKWHGFDKFYHFFMQKIDQVAPGYEPAEYEHYEKLHNMVLAIADEMVGIVLDGLKDDTSLVVISDHGLIASRRCVWVNRYLAQNGYIAFTKGDNGESIVDWTRTKAYVSAFLLLNVNLKGRDPDGIAEPGEEYEKIKAELIELLRGWVDPKTGLHVMSDVFDPKKDGAFYGLGSDLDGDIRYFTTPGYTLYRSVSPFGEETITDVAGPYLGDHGSCRPTARFGRGGEVGIFYAVGKGFKQGYKRPYPIQPADVIPTLLHILGEKPLRNQEGAVVYDLLNDSVR